MIIAGLKSFSGIGWQSKKHVKISVVCGVRGAITLAHQHGGKEKGIIDKIGITFTYLHFCDIADTGTH